MGRYALCAYASGEPIGEGFEIDRQPGDAPRWVDSWSPGTRTVWVRDQRERGGSVIAIHGLSLAMAGLRAHMETAP